MSPALRTFLTVALIMCACSAPAQIRDMQEAERHERAGRSEEALASYRAAQTSCAEVDNRRRRRDACAAAHLQFAELLVSEKRLPEAARAYHQAEASVSTRPAAAQACYAAALVYRDLGNDKEAYRYLWRTVTHYPEQAFAADALKHLLRDGRARAPTELRTQLVMLLEKLGETLIADNLLVALAELEEHEFDSPEKALAYYDQVHERFPKSGLFDDSLWHGARISRALGDAPGAVKRLRKLLATREVAFGAGSYFSVWLDDAQLALGIILRDDLSDHQAALRAFARLPKDYPASLYRDDALFERAVTNAQLQRNAPACKDLSRLKRSFPGSKYELEKAPKLRLELNCKP